jgi:hypothetical protein
MHQRAYEHRSGPRRRGAKALKAWQAELMSAGLRPEFLVLDAVAGAKLRAAEDLWIAKARNRGWPLVNASPSGSCGGPGACSLCDLLRGAKPRPPQVLLDALLGRQRSPAPKKKR